MSRTVGSATFPRPEGAHRPRGPFGRALARTVAGAVLIAAALPAALVPTASADTAPPDTTLPATVSSDALPTAQIDSAGVVWSQTVVGNTVYAGGSFTKARPAGAAPGTSEVSRPYLLAYNITTGVLTSFAPLLDAQVLSVSASPDGSTLYVAGDFTHVGTTTRNHVAAFSTSTGALTSWNPNVNKSVKAIFATTNTVYIGGPLTSVGTQTRHGSAGISVSTGLATAFDPVITGGSVRSVVAKADGTRVVLGGAFSSVNGSTGALTGTTPGYGIVLLDPTNSKVNLPMPMAAVVRDGSTDGSAAIDTLVPNPDGTGFYGGGFNFDRSQANLEGTFKATWAGDLTWLEDCHGDTYSVLPNNGVLYAAGHTHYCGNDGGFPQTEPFTFQRATAFTAGDPRGTISKDLYTYHSFEGKPRPQLLTWFPDLTPGNDQTGSKKSQAAWSIAGNADYVVYGGEFPKVNDVRQQGLVRFARTGIAPNADGPRLSGADFAPLVQNFAQGVRVSWPANYDRDNEQLSYELYKNGNTTTPVLTKTVLSTFWRRPNLTYFDTSVTAGQSYSYQLKATDPLGNSVLSTTVSITAGGGPSLTGYDRAALADGPQYYWPYNETSGTTATDIVGGENGLRGSGVTSITPGAVTGDSGAYRFSGTSTGSVSTTTARQAPQIFSVEAWFKTTSTTGGRIIGFGNAKTGLSTASDRHLYLGSTGKVSFGVYPNTQRAVSSGSGYNNGQWHHVVGTLSPAGQFLYLDGALAASSTTTVSAQASVSNVDVLGYWRVGGDKVTGWPNAGSSDYLAGDIDEPAVYPVALSAAQVSAHYAARTGGGGGTNQAPTAAFSSTTSALTASFDGTGSTDPDGTIASYAWNFGDSKTGTGASPSHPYTAAGTYTVKLTVTDDDGATGTVSHNVTVTAGSTNQPPTAAFTSSTSGLTASFDGTGSTDTDGTIASYAWNFGDSKTGTGASPSHPYTAAGTYTVKLTVTDDDGATDVVSHDVTVTGGTTNTPFASDAFDRTLSTGLGTADVGGPWTVSTASGFAVANGAGLFKLSTAGTTRSASLGATTRDSTDLVLNLSPDKATAGGTTYLYVEGRRVNTTTEYRSVLKLGTAGTISVGLEALKGSSTATSLASSVTVPGTIGAGTVIHVRMQTYGTSPTTVRSKVWVGSASEPSAWTVSATDTYANLQVPGAVGLIAYVSSGATNAPVTLSLLDLVARPVA